MEYVNILITLPLLQVLKKKGRWQEEDLCVNFEQPPGLGRTQRWGLWADIGSNDPNLAGGLGRTTKTVRN